MAYNPISACNGDRPQPYQEAELLHCDRKRGGFAVGLHMHHARASLHTSHSSVPVTATATTSDHHFALGMVTILPFTPSCMVRWPVHRATLRRQAARHVRRARPRRRLGTRSGTVRNQPDAAAQRRRGFSRRRNEDRIGRQLPCTAGTERLRENSVATGSAAGCLSQFCPVIVR